MPSLYRLAGGFVALCATAQFDTIPVDKKSSATPTLPNLNSPDLDAFNIGGSVGEGRSVSMGAVAVATQDFTINQMSPMTVMMEATNIPRRASIEPQFFAENGTYQGVATAQLMMTFELSLATASITLSRGWSGACLDAIWKHPKGRRP